MQFLSDRMKVLFVALSSRSKCHLVNLLCDFKGVQRCGDFIFCWASQSCPNFQLISQILNYRCSSCNLFISRVIMIWKSKKPRKHQYGKGGHRTNNASRHTNSSTTSASDQFPKSSRKHERDILVLPAKVCLNIIVF